MHTNFAVAMMAGTVHQDVLVSGASFSGSVHDACELA
jgi:hypothetical protein